MLSFVRRLLVALVALAIIGGSGPAFARAFHPAGPTAMANMPCHMSVHMVAHGAEHADHREGDPCKGDTSNCCAQMCGSFAGLPSQIISASVPVLLTRVDYPALRSQMEGVPSAPEPLPPRTS